MEVPNTPAYYETKGHKKLYSIGPRTPQMELSNPGIG
jgi:hypothetical protein